jgi:glycosyltransferase involved in cell wall biosynthesis
MIIGVDASRALRQPRTGTERYALEILTAMLRLPAAAGHEWRLVVDRDPMQAPAWAGDPLPPHAQWRILPARRLWTHRALGREVTRHRPDVLFVPSHVLPLRCLNSLPPAVVTIHDLGYIYEPQAHPLLQRLYLLAGTRWSIHAATRVIAVSQATARDVVDLAGGNPQRVRVIYEAGASQVCPTTAAQAAVRSRLNLPDRYALYVGTLQPRKNLARLVAAYTRLIERDATDFDLVLAGRITPHLADLAESIRRGPLAGRIHLPGYVAEADLPALLAGALCFCYPSLHEGFGLPVLEAQQVGVPVMTSNNSSLPEVAGDAAILVDPLDVEAMAQAMLDLSRDNDLRARLIAAGHANVQRFSWDKAAAETLAVLEEAARAGRP